MNIKKYIILFSVFLFCGSLLAQNDFLRKRIIPNKANIDSSLKKEIEYERIVVKLHEGTDVRLRANKLKHNALGRGAVRARRNLEWSKVQADLNSLENEVSSHGKNIRRLISIDESKLLKLKEKGERKSGRELADMNLYFYIPIKPNDNKASLSSMLRKLNALDSVEIAYAEPVTKPMTSNICNELPHLCPPPPPPPGGGGGTTPDYEAQQGYLQSATNGGLDAQYAWTVAGGNGQGITIIDIEFNWNLNHEDIPVPVYQGGAPSGGNDHGTAVLAEMVGRDNDLGVKGMVYAADFGVHSAFGIPTAQAITAATNNLDPGDVMLIELHRRGPANASACNCNIPQCDFIAVEHWPAEFDAIFTATALGITVVEAAGNGSTDLDDPVYLGNFDRDVRDSGAILVGASESDNRVPMCWSNNGTRVDVHAWGENVVTAGYGDLLNSGANSQYTAIFGGTSSASPMVAASVASIQGAQMAKGLAPFTPLEVRNILVDTGTPQVPGIALIGPMPNLRDALNADGSTTPLAAPNLTVQHLFCYGSNFAQWNTVTGALNYQIYISSTSAPPTNPWVTQTGTFKNVVVSSSTSVWVKACDNEGCSAYSNKGLARYTAGCY